MALNVAIKTECCVDAGRVCTYDEDKHGDCGDYDCYEFETRRELRDEIRHRHTMAKSADHGNVRFLWLSIFGLAEYYSDWVFVGSEAWIT